MPPTRSPRPTPVFTVALLVLLGLLALGARASEPAEVAAVRRLLAEADPPGRAAAVRRLADAEGRAAEGLIVGVLADPHPYVRRAAAGVLVALPRLESHAARRSLAPRLRRIKSPQARAAACRVFALWGDGCGRRALLASLDDKEPGVRVAALDWLADPRVGFVDEPGEPGQEILDALAAGLTDGDGGVRALALDLLSARPGQDAPSPAFLRDPDSRVRLSALESSVAATLRPSRALGDEGGSVAVVAVLHGLTDAVWSVRLVAAELSGRVPDRRLLGPLIRTLGDSRLRVARAAHASLVTLTGIPFEPIPSVWEAWLAGDGAAFDPAAGPVTAPREEVGAPAPPPEGRTLAAPRFLGLPLVSRSVGFVIDASGSMGRRLTDGTTRWDRARLELEAALGALDEGGAARVNVIVFRDEAERLLPRVLPPTRGRRKDIAERLAALAPGGRTALFDGVAAALEDPELDSIVVLSDGAPSAGAWFTKTDLLAEVKRLNRWRHARIDVISIGGDRVASRWRTALKRLAEDSGGTCIRAR